MRRIFPACVIAAAVLAACAAPRQTLGTRSSVCFRSLPTAKAAVHERGRLVGVRRISRGHLLRAFPDAALPAGREFCVVAFSGDFHRGQVEAPAGPPAGRDAVVIVTERGTSVIQTWLADRVPFRVRHP